MHGAVHWTRGIAHNWHISVENKRPCYSGHYPRLEDKLMNIFGTCTHCSDIYFDNMMLAFEDFIRRHRLKSVQSTSERRHSECQKYVIRRGQYPRLKDNISNSSLELWERCIIGKHSSCLRYGCMRRCPLSSTRG